MNLDAFIFALIGGILPALVWLLFWLREDRKSPEPDGLILKTFCLGMVSVLLVLPFQKGVDWLFPGMIFIPVILWSILEEMFKFGAGYFGGLHSVEDNEPLDPIIYMITAALGFVALENTLFILGPLLGEDIPRTLITGNLRFIGASLLHVVCSGLIGVMIAFNFYENVFKKFKKVLLGLLLAIAFHAIFNLLILTKGELGAMIAFISVWGGVVWLLWTFERAKAIAPRT